MPLVRKRRAEAADPESAGTPNSNPRRQRPREDSDEPDAEMSDSDGGPDAPSGADAMVKKLVRLALSSEYSRLPIRRGDISAKVLGEQGSRQFKIVFETAQKQLRTVFGMELTELPAREKVTVAQRRAAVKSEKPSSTNKAWILTTTLPTKYRHPDILAPTRAPSSTTESTYTALYSFIIAVVALNGGSLAEQKLTRYLARMNADTYTPIDRTDRLLGRLCREGYLVKTREMDAGEEIIEYLVGPRGKVEVGTTGVAGLVREVYGHGRVNDRGDGQATNGDPDAREDFEARLRRSLGIVGGVEQTHEGEEAQRSEPRQEAERRRQSEPRRSSRRGAREEEEEEEEEEESEEESD